MNNRSFTLPEESVSSIRAFRSWSYDICARVGFRYRRFVKVMLGRDGSIMISSPDYPTHTGCIISMRLPKGRPPPSVGYHGLVTTRNIKLSHHPDGEAHFSMDGQIYTSARRKSVPLSSYSGHLFTVHCHNLSKYGELSEQRLNCRTSRRSTIVFDDLPWPIDGLKFVGRLYPASQVYKNSTNSTEMPISIGPDGTLSSAAVLSAGCLDGLEEKVLILTWHSRVAQADNVEELGIMGGFDPPEVVYDLSMETGFIVATFPEVNYEKMRTLYGSADYSPISRRTT